MSDTFAPASPLAASQRPSVTYVFGDSHSLAYNYRLFKDSDGRSHLFRALYSSFSSDSCAAAAGSLAEAIAEPLAREGLLRRVDDRYEALHRTADRTARYFAMVEGNPLTDPTLVFSVGGLDAVSLGVALNGVDDMVLPPARRKVEGPLSGEPLANSLAFEDVVTTLLARFEPLAAQLNLLRELGFMRLGILSLAPPTSNEAAYIAAKAGIHSPLVSSHVALPWRTKLHLVVNVALATIAAKTKIEFIDMWDAQTDNDVVLTGLLADSFHLRPWAADKTANEILKRFEGVTGAMPTEKYYQVYIADPSGIDGIRELTITSEDFASLTQGASSEFVLLRDINQKTATWINRSRIVRIGEIGSSEG